MKKIRIFSKLQRSMRAFFLLSVSFCTKQANQEKTKQEEKKTPEVYIKEVKKTELASLITLSGPVRAKNERQLFSQVSGVVSQIYKNPGDSVSKGEKMFSIIRDSQQGEQFLAHQVFAEAAGTFLKLVVKPGERIAALAPLGTIGDPKILWIETQSTYKDLQILKTPTRIKVALSGSNPKDALGEAKLIFVEPSADKKTGTFSVAFELTCQNCPLKSGMLAKIFVESDIKQTILLEEKAIRRREKENYVLIVHEGKAQKKSVTLGPDQGDGTTQILSGLTSGDTVIVSSSKPVDDGDQVNVISL